MSEEVGSVRSQTDPARASRADDGLEPWQFFVLASLVCATAATVIARGQSATAVILLSVMMATVCLVGIAALRALRPLVAPEDDRTAMIGHRTRTALEREKLMTLRALKELDFDRAMGKLSDADWQEMSARLRARATGLMRQLDSDGSYREQVERDLAARLTEVPPTESRSSGPTGQPEAAKARGNFCTDCGTKNEADAKFCKNCGHRL
jgi:hypothetical protein